MKYRVYYPLITKDGYCEFNSKEAAERFANEKRNRQSPYLTIHSWRQVRIEQIEQVD